MEIGDKLKNLVFKFDEDKSITEIDLKGKTSIIYFYPKDDTPGCTKEAIEFTDFLSKFEKLNTIIIGISKDSVEKHQKFKVKHKIKFDLATDDDGKLCDKFKVWVEKSMYGKKYMGIQRATFIIDENLNVINSWRNVKVKGHVEEVYEYIKNL